MLVIHQCDKVEKCTPGGLHMKFTDGGNKFVSDSEMLKFFPIIAISIEANYPNWFSKMEKECLSMLAPFPTYVAEYLFANVTRYTRKDYETLDDVRVLFDATREMNLLQINQIAIGSHVCGCESLTKAFDIVMDQRGTDIYVNAKDSQNIHCDVDLTSGLTIRSADDKEIFICDRGFIDNLPLYERSLTATQPNWRKEKFDFSVKVPFTMTTTQFLIDNIDYVVPPQVVTEALAKKYYQKATEASFEELADLSEAAVFFETKVFEEAISYVMLERLGRLGRQSVHVLDEFDKIIEKFNYGYDASTSTAEPEKQRHGPHQHHHCCHSHLLFHRHHHHTQ